MDSVYQGRIHFYFAYIQNMELVGDSLEHHPEIVQQILDVCKSMCIDGQSVLREKQNEMHWKFYDINMTPLDFQYGGSGRRWDDYLMLVATSREESWSMSSVRRHRFFGDEPHPKVVAAPQHLVRGARIVVTVETNGMTVYKCKNGNTDVGHHIDSFDDIFLYTDLEDVLTPGQVLVSEDLEGRCISPENILQKIMESYALRRSYLLI